MNETIQTLLNRRAIRRYQDRPVDRSILETIVECARFAPTAMNTQPYKFIMVTDPDFRNQLAAKAKKLGMAFAEGVKESNPERYEIISKRFVELADPVLYGAPAILFIAGKGEWGPNSAALAAANAMNAAKSLGLGSCWIGMAVALDQDPEVRKAFQLTEDEHLQATIILGYPDEDPQAAPRKSEVIWL